MSDVQHTVKKKKIGQSEKLDRICRACGQIWTRTARRFWRTYRKRGEWLSKYDMQKWMCTDSIKADPQHEDLQCFSGKTSNSTLHRVACESTDNDPHYVDETRIASQVRQGVVRSFYDALKTWQQAKEKMHANGNDGFRPPHRPKKFFKAQWNYKGIKKRDNRLRLMPAQGEDPIWIDWPHPTPISVEIGWADGEYEVRAKYKTSQDDLPGDFIRTREPKGDGVVGVDLGEKYLAAMADEKRSLLLGGNKLRELRAIREGEKEWFASRIDRKQKGSNRFWKLVNAKRKRLASLRNQIEDVMHKQTTRLVEEAWAWGAATIVIGKITGIRDRMDFGADMNRRLHQWAFRQFTEKVEYKAKRYGMTVEYVGEAYTSQTCPSCGTAKRSHKQGRRFTCSECDFEAHRDQVGARNIRQKYLAEQDQDSAPMESGYLKAVRATATDKGTPEDCQFDLFKRGNSEGRRTTPVLESPKRVGYDPHMPCVITTEG